MRHASQRGNLSSKSGNVVTVRPPGPCRNHLCTDASGRIGAEDLFGGNSHSLSMFPLTNSFLARCNSSRRSLSTSLTLRLRRPPRPTSSSVWCSKSQSFSPLTFFSPLFLSHSRSPLTDYILCPSIGPRTRTSWTSSAPGASTSPPSSRTLKPSSSVDPAAPSSALLPVERLSSLRVSILSRLSSKSYSLTDFPILLQAALSVASSRRLFSKSI